HHGGDPSRWVAGGTGGNGHALLRYREFHFETGIFAVLQDQTRLSAVPGDDAADHAQQRRRLLGPVRLWRGGKSDVHHQPLVQHNGADRNRFSGGLRQRLFRVNQEVQKNLLQLALRTQHEQRLGRDQVDNAYPRGLPHFRGDGRYLAAGHAGFRLPQRLCRQFRNRGQRRLQFVGDRGDQPAHGRQLLGAEELFLHGSLVLQPNGHADLVPQVLRQSLLVRREVAGAVVLVQFEHAHQLALRHHGDEEEGFRGPGAVVSRDRERAAVDIGNRQQRTVGEARHRAGLSSGGRRSERNGNRRAALFRRRVQRLGGAIVDVQLNPGDAGDAGQNRGNSLQNGARRRGTQNFFAELVRLPQPFSLLAQPAFAAPQEKGDEQHEGKPRRQRQRGQRQRGPRHLFGGDLDSSGIRDQQFEKAVV